MFSLFHFHWRKKTKCTRITTKPPHKPQAGEKNKYKAKQFTECVPPCGGFLLHSVPHLGFGEIIKNQEKERKKKRITDVTRYCCPISACLQLNFFFFFFNSSAQLFPTFIGRFEKFQNGNHSDLLSSLSLSFSQKSVGGVCLSHSPK